MSDFSDLAQCPECGSDNVKYIKIIDENETLLFQCLNCKIYFEIREDS
jgi:transcription elongation factor Elf1